jgi:hypothetical protein
MAVVDITRLRGLATSLARASGVVAVVNMAEPELSNTAHVGPRVRVAVSKCVNTRTWQLESKFRPERKDLPSAVESFVLAAAVELDSVAPKV